MQIAHHSSFCHHPPHYGSSDPPESNPSSSHPHIHPLYLYLSRVFVPCLLSVAPSLHHPSRSKQRRRSTPTCSEVETDMMIGLMTTMQVSQHHPPHSSDYLVPHPLHIQSAFTFIFPVTYSSPATLSSPSRSPHPCYIHCSLFIHEEIVVSNPLPPMN